MAYDPFAQTQSSTAQYDPFEGASDNTAAFDPFAQEAAPAQATPAPYRTDLSPRAAKPADTGEAPSDMFERYESEQAGKPGDFWHEFAKHSAAYQSAQQLEGESAGAYLARRAAQPLQWAAEVYNNNILGNVVHGIQRIFSGEGTVSENLQKELHSAWDSVSNIAESHPFEDFQKASKENPGALAAGLVDSFREHPEAWVVPGGFGGKVAEATSAAAAKVSNTLAKVAYVGSRSGESAVAGGLIGGAIPLSEQMKTGEYDLGKVVAGAEMAAGPSALMGLRLPPKFAPKTAAEASTASSSLVDELAKAYQETLPAGEAPKDDATLSAEQQAYALMKGKVDKVQRSWFESNGQYMTNEETLVALDKEFSTKTVENITKKNPLVGEALDKMMQKRADIIEAFKQLPTEKELKAKEEESNVIPNVHIMGDDGIIRPMTQGDVAAGKVGIEAKYTSEADIAAESAAEGVRAGATPESVARAMRFHYETSEVAGASRRAAAEGLTEKTTLPRGTVIGEKEQPIVPPEVSALMLNLKVKAAEAVPPAQRTLEDLLYIKHKVNPDAKIITKDTLGYNLPPEQAGMAQTDMLKYLGMISLGAAGGAVLDPEHPVGAAVLGGIGGASLMALPKALAAIPGHWKAAAAGGAIGYAESDEHPYTAAAIAALGARYLHIKMAPETALYVRAADKAVSENINNKAAYARTIWNLQTAINKMVPDKERLNNISRYLDGSKHLPLTKDEMQVANAAKQFFDSTGKAAVDAGVLKGLRENYVSHIIDWSGKTDQEIASIRQMIFGDLSNKGATISGSSKFAKQRKYDTFDELNTVLAKYGVKLKTENVSEIIGIYGNSMRRAIEDKRLIDQLKALKDEKGRALIDSPSRENTDYAFIPTSSLANLRVHPEIAPALKVIADSKDDGALGAVHALAMGLKRMETVSTLFHAASLVDVAIGAGTFRTTMRSMASGVPGLNKFVRPPEVLDQFRKGSINDDASLGIKQGLTFGTPADLDPTSMNSVARQVGKWADNVLPTRGAGEKLGGAMSAFNHAIDSITWAHAYTGTKLAIFQKEMEKALLDNAKARQKDPSIPEITKEQAAKAAATFANDLAGGQNWFQMATATKSQLARKLALTAVSKRGMMLQQIAMFAPDWTVSTFKSMYKGIGSMLPKELGLPGVPTEDLLRGMYRRYALRSLTAYMMIGNAVNYAYSGHSVFENKDSSGNVDPTFIDMGDGRKMYLSKHSTEFFKWMEHPSQELLNKVGSIPSEVATQATGTEYLTTDPKKAQPIGDRLAHLASKFVPMPITAGIKGGAVSALSSFIGRPIYGKTTAQREQERMDKRTQIKPMKLSDMMK